MKNRATKEDLTTAALNSVPGLVVVLALVLLLGMGRVLGLLKQANLLEH